MVRNFFDGHDEVYHHAKFGKDRSMRAGCRYEYVVFAFTGRIAAKRQPAAIKFTHRPKIRFFAPQGRLAAPIQVKLGRDDGNRGPLSGVIFHLNRRRVLGMRPKISKNFHFLVKSRPAGVTALTDLEYFWNIFGIFYILH